jgi:hypothetical protein
LQKGELLNQGLALPLGIFSSLDSISPPVGQALEFLLNHVPGLAWTNELALEKGDLPNRLARLPASRSNKNSGGLIFWWEGISLI